jgi:hypothetical protein
MSNYTIPVDGILPEGRLNKFLSYWNSIANHSWLLPVIQHSYKVQFARQSTAWQNQIVYILQDDQQHVNQAI